MPTDFSTSVWMLAQQSRIEAMNQGVRAYQSDHGYTIVLMAISGLALAVAGGIVVLVKWQQQRRLNDPKRLFRELCRAHQVTLSQRLLLKSLAKKRKLSDPNMLFIDASLWAFSPANEPTFCAPATHKRFLTLQRMFFTHPERTPTPISPA